MASSRPPRPRPPKRRIIIELPSRPADYVPNSGPLLRLPFLQPPADSTAYIDDRILLPPAGLAAADGRPLPKRMKYIVGWWDLPAARLLVPAMDVLDYVSPHALEEWEYKMELELDAAVVAETEGGSGGEQGRLHGGAMGSLSTPRKRKRKEFLESGSSEESPSEQLRLDVARAKRARELDVAVPHPLRPVPVAPMAPVAPMVLDDGARLHTAKNQLLKRPGVAPPMTMPLVSAAAATKSRPASPAVRLPLAKARERDIARPSTSEQGKLSMRDPARQSTSESVKPHKRDPVEHTKQSMRDPAKQAMRDPTKTSTRELAKPSKRDSVEPGKLSMRDLAKPYTRDPAKQSISDLAKPSMREQTKTSMRDPARLSMGESANLSIRNPAKPSTHTKQHSSRPMTEYLSAVPKHPVPPQPSAQRPSKRPSETHAEKSHPRPHAQPKYRPHVAQKKKPSRSHARSRSPDRSKGKQPALPIFSDSDSDEPDWAVECLEDMELYDVEGRGLIRYFKVRWEGDWPPDQKSTWEPEENIPDHLVREFCRTVAEQKRKAASSLEPRHGSKAEEDMARLPPLRPTNMARSQGVGKKEEEEEEDRPSSANSGMFVYSSDDGMDKHVWDAPNSQGARPNLNLVYPAPML
ncbi:Chromo domain [Cordyceps militaris CM01]|uniref:Chromo domain n=1 Tax=Cordyceps militaris (strain CM01) TaxID=983644 RepID=G3JBB7_CORMM|nr:Chromo domain [Cordyceps militaris CM01]EGX95275.1 Chromo domain [Cordyceps militaris CM01]